MFMKDQIDCRSEDYVTAVVERLWLEMQGTGATSTRAGVVSVMVHAGVHQQVELIIDRIRLQERWRCAII